MALEFFRRRQKMVIVMMVILMVAFLIPSGLSVLLQRDPMKRVIGTSRAGNVTHGEQLEALADLEILRSLGLSAERYPMVPTQFEFLALTQTQEEDRPALAYALLLREAKAAGILAGRQDVDALFASIGLGQEEDYKDMLATLRSPPRTWTENRIRAAVHDWLLINRSFASAMVDAPPSEPEVAIVYRDLRERINLRVLRLKASDFLLDVPEPNQARIQAQFDRYRNQFPGQLVLSVDEFGFGYRQPDRARVGYLFLRSDVIRRVVEPTFDQVSDYFNQNRSEFVKKVPAFPLTQPGGATQPATGPASQPTVEVAMTFAEAKELIVEKLRDEAARDKTENLVATAVAEARRVLQGTPDPNSVYAEVRKAMQHPAEAELARALKGVDIQNRPLDEAVSRLAEAAKLKAICYPWGTHGDQTLLPTVKVSLKADGMTLGAALEEITRQVKWPALTWATCTSLPDALFSVASPDGKGVDFSPLQVGRTGLLTPQEMAEDPLLGYSYASSTGGLSLVQAAFTGRGISVGARETQLVAVGKEGPRMYVVGDKPGRLIWTLLAADPAHVPAGVDAEPGLRERIVKDLKAQAAFQRAMQEGEKVSKAAAQIGLEAVASHQNRKTATTGLFSRKQLNLAWSNVPELLTPPKTLPPILQEALKAFVITEAFKLAPKGAEASGKMEGPALGVAPVRLEREVLVLERIGFDPALRPEYDEFGRRALAEAIVNRRQQQITVEWFHPEAVAQRLAFAWRKD